MPVQTKNTSHIYFPDGALVQVKEKNGTYFDVGAINSAVTATLNWDESTVETANAGKLNTRISNMEIAGGFTLINLDPEGVAKLGNGVFMLTTVDADTPITSGIAAQEVGEVAIGDMIELSPAYSNGGGIKISSTTAPTFVVKDGDDTLGSDDFELVTIGETGHKTYFVKFKVAHDDVTITYSSITPVSSTKISAGSSTKVLTAYSMKISHEDSNGKIRSLELFSVYGGSGSFQFNFKGANEDGVEEMPLTFTARLDTSRVDNDQLFEWTIDEDAQ